MIGIDTNVLVRYVVQDEPAQSAAASALIEDFTEEQQGFVSVVTAAEIFWVLRRAYKVSATDVFSVIRMLLDAAEIVVQEADAVRRALDRRTAHTADFADALIAELGTTAGCVYTVTFDRAASTLPGMQLIAS